jgi:hypothetical protein
MWSYDNGDPDLALSSATDQNTSLMGTLSKLGPSTFTINLSDATGRSAPALSCSITVVPPPPPALTITSSAPCPATPLDFGSQFTRNFTASGGVPDYRWSVTPASFTLSSATGTTTSLSGTLSTPGPISLTVTLTDSTGATQTFACSLTVNAPPITGSLVVGTLPQDLTQGAPVTLSLTSPSPVALSGRVTLTFTPTSSIPVDNPSVTFSSGSRVFSFNLPAGGGPLVLPAIQRGMVAGTIRVQVTELTAGGVNVLPSSPIFQTITVPSLPPSFTFQINSTGAGFDIVISGFSTTRDITGGTITFNAASGATVEGGTVDLGALGIAKTFSDFYSNINRSMGESMFKNLTIPVSISGDKSAIGSIAVTLTNSAGSATVTKSP